LSLGPHTITASVTDSGDLSAVAEISITVGPPLPPPPPPPAVVAHIGGLEDMSQPKPKNRWDAMVRVQVMDAYGAPVPDDAVVAGDWSNGFIGTDICTIAGGNGQCTVTKANLKAGNVPSLTFTVTMVSGDPVDDYNPNFVPSIESIDLYPNGPPVNQPPVAAYMVDPNPCEFNFTLELYLCFFTDTSSDSDGFVASRSWDFGDGNVTADPNPIIGYPVAGDYQFTLTVTDDDGAEDSLNGSVQAGTPSPPLPGTPTLSANGYKVKGKQKVDLDWSGAAVGGSVDIYRDSNLIQANVPNDANSDSGSYTDNIDLKGGGSYIYEVCEAGTAFGGATCSAPPIPVVF
jgi:hypothetical protein